MALALAAVKAVLELRYTKSTVLLELKGILARDLSAVLASLYSPVCRLLFCQ